MADMPAITGFSRVARRPSERLALVEFILNTSVLPETDFLEWKTGYDLSSKFGAGKAAKHLIGFANREPSRAMRAIEGHAYLLLGVEPGNLEGVPFWDSADIEAWISRYVIAELVYDVGYVQLQGKNVLVLTVAPPKQGDSIFALQKATGEGQTQLAEGTIYVRRPGKTEVHSAADLVMLTARARATSTNLALTMEANGSALLPLAAELDEGFRDRYLAGRRAALLRDVPDHSDPLAGILSSASEFRGPKAYIAEVERFLDAARRRWPEFAACEHLAHHESDLKLTVTNTTDDNFEDVSIEVLIPLPAMFVWLDGDHARTSIKPPREPAVWGKSLAARVAADMPRITIRGEPVIATVGENRTKVRFSPRHLYPRTEVELPTLAIVAPPAIAGHELIIEWRATAKNTRGVISGISLATVPELESESAGSAEPAAGAA